MNFGALYATRCAGCHGADGKLGPAPPLNDPLFLSIVPDAEVLRVISEGRAVSATQKTPMPAFRLGKGTPLTEAQAKTWAELKEAAHVVPKQQSPLTEAQVKVLAEGLKKHWGTPAPPLGSVPPYLASTLAGGGKDSALPGPPPRGEPERVPPPRGEPERVSPPKSEPSNPSVETGKGTKDGG